MIEMAVNDGVILLKPLDQSCLGTAAILYNSSGDYRFATGIASPVPYLELSEKLDRLETSKNEFFDGIFVMDVKKTSEAHSHLAGVISGILSDKLLWIKLLAILPEYRHMGIGRRAAALLLRHSNACYGISEAFLSVVEKNDTGVDFWLRQGFSEAGRFSKELFDDRQPYEVIIMHKRL